MLAASPAPPRVALPAPLVQVLRQEARAELAAEFACHEVERLRKELEYAQQTARQAAAEAATARRHRLALERTADGCAPAAE